MKNAEAVRQPAKDPASAPLAGEPAKAGRAVRKKAKSIPVAGPDLQQMISEAAYFRAEQRGFAAGAELQDWLEAEQAVRRFASLDDAAATVR